MPPKVTKSRSYKNFNQAKFINSLKKKDWDKITSYSNVDTAWSVWSDMFNDVCNEHAPIRDKRIKGYLPEWVTSEFLQLSKEEIL